MQNPLPKVQNRSLHLKRNRLSLLLTPSKRIDLSTVDQPLKDSIVKPEESGYKRNVLQMFLEGLHQKDGSHLLDLGQISEDITGFLKTEILS